MRTMRALSSIVVVCLVAAASVRPVDADELYRASAARLRVESSVKSARAIASHGSSTTSGSVRWRAGAPRLDGDRGNGPGLSPAIVTMAWVARPPDVTVDLVQLSGSRIVASRVLGNRSARGPPSVG